MNNSQLLRTEVSLSRRTRRLIVALLATVAAPAAAQTRPVDLSGASLEDLMNIEITSASRKEQRAEDVPAAVYVVTRDDIRRSGMTSVPDLLRLVPGVQVAQINANKWAISVRGFNGLYSNKLLVLIDGRSVYSPLFSAVLWDTEDLMLEDVDRIEVIRGPGGAVWGANAVNGVINILTRPAGDTRGLLVRADAGNVDHGSAAVRYGGTAGRGAYRVYSQLTTHGDSLLAPGAAANDHWRSLTSGFRGDWSLGSEAFMLQSSVSVGQERPLWMSLDPAANGETSGVSDTQVGNVLGRWTHTRGNGATLQLQSFVDLAHRGESIVAYRRRTVDLDAVYHTPAGRHDLVGGGGYRYIDESADGGVGFSFTPSGQQKTLVNAFAQDEISLARHRVALTLGTKVEFDTDQELTLQPTARIMWQVTPQQRLWAAASRALRTPSLVDEGIRIDFPPIVAPAMPGDPLAGVPIVVSVAGNPAAQNERLVSTEAGYRIDITSRAAIDVAGFIGHYQHLQSTEPSTPTLVFVGGRPVLSVVSVFQNLQAADTRGAEITARVKLSSGWQVDGTFSAFHLTPHPDASSHDPLAPTADGNAPSYQWRGHSAFSLGSRAQLDALVFYVGGLRQLGIPAYTRADIRCEWTVTPWLSAAAHGQNLLSPAHAEFVGGNATMVSTQVPRSGSLRLTWRF
ncbi:MAG: TonB-dependent receptor [Acidobacteriota bacterium]